MKIWTYDMQAIKVSIHINVATVPKDLVQFGLGLANISGIIWYLFGVNL